MKRLLILPVLIIFYSCTYLNNPFLPDSFISTLNSSGAGNITVTGDLSFNEVLNTSTSEKRRIFLTKVTEMPVTWTATPTQSWITVSPSTGTLTGSSYFDVTINGTSLANTAYNESITLTSTSGTLSLSTIPVTVSGVRSINDTSGITWATINTLGQKMRWTIPGQVPSGITRITVYYRLNTGPVNLGFQEGGAGNYYNSSFTATGTAIGMFTDEAGFKSKSVYFQLYFNNGSSLPIDIWKIKYYTSTGLSGELLANGVAAYP